MVAANGGDGARRWRWTVLSGGGARRWQRSAPCVAARSAQVHWLTHGLSPWIVLTGHPASTPVQTTILHRPTRSNSKLIQPLPSKSASSPFHRIKPAPLAGLSGRRRRGGTRRAELKRKNVKFMFRKSLNYGGKAHHNYNEEDNWRILEDKYTSSIKVEA